MGGVITRNTPLYVHLEGGGNTAVEYIILDTTIKLDGKEIWDLSKGYVPHCSQMVVGNRNRKFTLDSIGGL